MATTVFSKKESAKLKKAAADKETEEIIALMHEGLKEALKGNTLPAR